MRRTDLENKNERYVAGKDDDIDCRESARYNFALQHLVGKKILDVGCSSGYGIKVMGVTPELIDYVGIDYDQKVLEYAREQFGNKGRFVYLNLNNQAELIRFLKEEKFDTIIAFEVIEHVPFGRELVELLQEHCSTLICSVPYNEPLGFWGEHHVLHNLTENDFPGFDYLFMKPDGTITLQPESSHFNLMLMKRDNTIQHFHPVRSSNRKQTREMVDIIIPHVDKTDELLFPLLKSLSDSIREECVITIICNGTNWEEYQSIIQFLDFSESEYLHYKLHYYTEKLGYTKAANIGIHNTNSPFVLLLNNDVVIKDSNFIQKLKTPILNKECGITGAKLHHAHFGLGKFIIGFCLMTSREVINTIGLLDEQFNPGGMEDVDFSIRAQRAGYDIQQIDINMYHPFVSSTMSRHTGDWQKIFDDNIIKLGNKYDKYDHVTAVICTRNRYEYLFQCLTAVLMQTEKIQKLVIIDDSDNDKRKDLRDIPEGFRLLQFASYLGIDWYVTYGEQRGQHISHEIGQNMAEELVWRVDDDCIPEPNVLHILKKDMRTYPQVGAVGGRVLTPGMQLYSPALANGKIENVKVSTNIQWYRETQTQFVEHLHCTFLYRKGIAHFPNTLSPVAHREETMFTYDIIEQGYKVLFNGDAITYHIRAKTGGIRDGSQENFEHDEKIFDKYLEFYNITLAKRHKIVWLNNGIGDHYAFLDILQELLEKHQDIIIAAAYPDVFSDITNLKIISIAEAEQVMSEKERDDLDIYGYMISRNWAGHLVDAYRALYLGDANG